MAMCESVRGEWGKPCPDCGATLPNPKPLSSWMAQRHIEGDPDERRGRKGRVFIMTAGPRLRGSEEHRAIDGYRWSRTRTRTVTPRMQKTLGLLRANDGNKKRTAEMLGVTVQAVQQTIYRARDMGIDA